MKVRKNKKIIYSLLIVLVILLLSYTFPSLARFKNRGASASNVWSGSVATKYRSGNGTRNNPYIISNGDELAFFSSQLENNHYEGSYFKIVNNILINEGMFKYEDNKIKYILNNNTYYVSGNKYYDNDSFTGNEIGSLNEMPNLDNFKGSLDADYHVIFGYYSDSPLFTSLNGDVTALFMENAMIVTNGSGAIFADNIESSSIADIVVDGYVVAPTYVEPVQNNEPEENQEEQNEPVVLTTIDLLTDYDNFDSPILGGIAIYAHDSSLINCINKSNINGGFIAGGILGYSDGSSIVNAYTNGSINSNISTAIGVFKGEGTIDKVYNSGTLNNGSLIGYVTEADVTITNSFIATDNFLLLDSKDSEITSSNNYYVSSGKGDSITSTLVTTSNLKDSSFLTGYSNFVSTTDLETHPLNVWIFDNNMYPILYLDDINNAYNELHINSYMWNSYSYNLNVHKVTNNMTIMISDVDNVHINTKYYYISNSQTPLTKSQLESVEWNEYDDVVIVNQEGFYVVYVKIVDNNQNVSYINSDVMILDNSGSEITISMGNDSWTSLTEGNIYIGSQASINVTATDTLSGVKSVEYYLSSSRINNIENIEWVPYTSPIGITSVGDYILYVRVIDNCDLVAYASTPLIVYDGYTVSNLKPLGFQEGSTISRYSSVSFDVSYSNNRTLNITHDLVTTTALPTNTKITMIDKTHNKVYEYVINSNITRIPFTSFKEVGLTGNVNYSESSIGSESYSFIFDFSSCDINTDYRNVYVYLEGINNSSVIRPTIQRNSFSLLSSGNVELTHSITTEFNGSITYKSDSVTNVEINNTVSMNGAYDTRLSDKKLGLAIKVVDSDNHVIESNYLKNIIFKIGDNKYAPDEDDIIRINLNTNTSSVVTLTIVTYDGRLTLDEGTYYIKIYGYDSYDGIYYTNTTDPITIPLTVSASNENTNRNYDFDVQLDNQARIIDKGTTANLQFVIPQSGITNPNIKVSLYQKDQLTAYNQDYTLIDMQDYTNLQLDEYIDSVYYVTRHASSGNNTFNYRMNTTNMDKTLYKFVFDLYDGNIKVESIVKYVIIR